MGKRNKEQQKQSNECHLEFFKKRPVTKADKWCDIPRIPRKGINPLDEAPYGYIVRSKKHCGKLLLQVVKKSNNPYDVTSFCRDEPNVSKKNRIKNKKYRILNIRNLKGIKDEWQY